MRGNAPPKAEIADARPCNALIIEDTRESEIEELLSLAGTEYTGKLIKGDYSLLWISTPNDWQRLLKWIRKALQLGILVILFGPPGFLWKVPNIKATIQESKMRMIQATMPFWRQV